MASDERDEARFITDNIIKQKTIFKVPYRDMAVLYRTNAQSRVVEEAFLRPGLPTPLLADSKFYERKEIKDILAYIRVIFNPSDTISLLRIINVPRRGIGDTSLPAWWNMPIPTVCHCLMLYQIRPVPQLMAKARIQLDGLAELLFKLIAKRDTLAVPNCWRQLCGNQAIWQNWKTENTPQSEARVENLRELLSVAKEYATKDVEDNLENFFSHVALCLIWMLPIPPVIR